MMSYLVASTSAYVSVVLTKEEDIEEVKDTGWYENRQVQLFKTDKGGYLRWNRFKNDWQPVAEI